MKQSPHQYPLFSDLIEAQKKSVLSFFEKGILEEFELFSYVQGKNIAMIFHGSKFFLQKPLFSFEYLVESQKTYSVSLFIPVEFQASKSEAPLQGGTDPSADVGADSAEQARSPRAGFASAVAKPTPSQGWLPSSLLAGEGRSPRVGFATAEQGWRVAPVASPREATGPSPRAGFASPNYSRGLSFPEPLDENFLQTRLLPNKGEAPATLNFNQNFSQRLAPWIYCGEIPFMTERGNFLINGSARVLVNQIVRCPSVYFKVRIDQKNRRTYIGSFLSEYGSWLRLETDYKNRLWVRIDKSERFSIYALLRALGFPETFLKYQLKYYSFLFASQEDHAEAGSRTRGTTWAPVAQARAYGHQSVATLSEAPLGAKPTSRGGAIASEPTVATLSQARATLSQAHATLSEAHATLSEARATLYVGDETANKRQSLRLHESAEAEVRAAKTTPTPSFRASQLTPHAAVQSIWKKCNPNRWNSLHGCYTFVYTKFFHPKKYSIGSVGRGRLNKRLIGHNQRARLKRSGAELRSMKPAPQAGFAQAWAPGAQASQASQSVAPRSAGFASTIPKINNVEKVNRLPTLTPEDIFMALDVLIRFHYGEGVLDDIDHLKNRRVRLPGELMQNQLRLALSRMTQASVDKLTNVVVSGAPLSEARASLGSGVGERSHRGEAYSERSYGQARGEGSVALAPSSEAPLQSPPPRLSAMASAGIAHSEAQARAYGHQSVATVGEQNNPSADAATKSHAPLPGRVNFAACIQTQVFSSTFKELFNTSQLSQYMDQTNPLAEITHKRRLSSLGPGGIAKDQAGVAVREIHPSHFGRICPIETPEGQNAGLVGSLATYCQLTSEGFLEAIYLRKPRKPKQALQPSKHVLVGEHGFAGAKPARSSALVAIGPSLRPPCESGLPRVERRLGLNLPPNYQRAEWFIFQADTEDEVFISAEQYRLATRGVAGPNKGKAFAGAASFYEARAEAKPAPPKYTPIRYRQEFFRVDEDLVEFFGVSPIQMISLATSLIPFLEHDDANRALMGSNMQRQAVPLMTTERAYVGTGLEVQAARDSTTLCCTQVSGQVSWIDAHSVVLQGDSSFGKFRSFHTRGGDGAGFAERSAGFAPATQCHQNQWEYDLQKYWRSNQNTCIYQKPNSQHGAWVEKGRCIADGAASSYGEIALGKNIFVAYMPWEGFNFEDAIVINQRLVDEDIYTSIHIERYDIDVMDTEYGREILGRDLLNSHEIPGIESSKPSSAERSYALRSPRFRAEESAGAMAITPQTPTYERSPAQACASEAQSLGAKPTSRDEARATSRGEVFATRGAPVASPREACATGPQTFGETSNLDPRGIILPGTWVEEDDILVGKMTPIAPPKPTPEYRLLLAIFETKPLPFRDTSLRVPPGIQGRILECIVKYEQVRSGGSAERSYAGLQPSVGVSTMASGAMASTPQFSGVALRSVESVQVFLVSKRKIQLGDKMSGRHGNKGIVSCILPPQDMPFVQDGTPLDIVLNPLGVPSRMNVGQVLECLFGFASKTLCENYRLIPFDEIYGEEASRGLVYAKLFEASKTTGYEWIFDPNHPGKTHIFDGRTGEAFHQPVLVGYSYMLKLIHQVDEKMHARSTGPYSLITQQPLGGRAKHGGQRLGEMEVWACEGFGASAVLHEFLTLKSDDIDSRNTFLFHVMKRKSLVQPLDESSDQGKAYSRAQSSWHVGAGERSAGFAPAKPPLGQRLRHQSRGEACATEASLVAAAPSLSTPFWSPSTRAATFL